MVQSIIAKPANKTGRAIRMHSQQLFVEQGYNAVSMRDIAAAVGVQPSAIYNHFAGKQEILVELMRETMEAISTGLSVAMSPDAAPDKLLEQFLRFHIAFHIDNPQVGFLSYMELRSLEEPGKAEVLAMRDAYESKLRAILHEGQQAGLFQSDHPDILARAILAMLTGVTVWYRPDGALQREEVIDSYVRAALRSAGLKNE